MNWITIGLLAFLLLVFVLILVTFYNLAPLGDERKQYIRQKAATDSFAVVLGFLAIEIGIMAYINLATPQTYEGLNPFTTLVVISAMYLLTLLHARKKYGG